MPRNCRDPNHYSAAAILPFRNGAFKIGIRYRMVLDLNGEMLLAVSVRQTLGQRPGFECSIHFKPQIVVQPGSILLLDDKRVRRSLADFAGGSAVFLKSRLRVYSLSDILASGFPMGSRNGL